MQRLHARAGCIPKQTRANSAMGVKEGNLAGKLPGTPTTYEELTPWVS